MALTAQQTAAANRISATYNGNVYNATTNAGGMAGGGHRLNFIPAIQDVVIAGQGYLTDAAASASAALASAGQASGSASSASGSAGAAASALSTVQGIYDSFDDRYLGAQATAPSLDNDGNALLVGALYFDTATNKMRVRASDNTWVTAYASLSGSISAPSTVVTGNLLSFATSDGTTGADSGVPASRVVTATGFTTLSGATTLTSADKGKVFTLSGSFRVTLPASPGVGFHFWVRKRDGGGVCELFTSTGNINSRVSIYVYQEEFLVYFDGSTYFTIGRQHGWIHLRTLFSSVIASTYTDTIGFSDPEMSQIELSYEYLAPGTTPSYPLLRVQKSSLIVSTATYYHGTQLYGATQSGSGVTGIPLATTAGLSSGNSYFGRVQFRGIQTAAAQQQAIEFRTGRALDTGAAMALGHATENSSAAMQGWWLGMSTGNINSIQYIVKGFRA